jgi:hypothetical protein
MVSFNKKLIWSALAVAVATTPALAQRQHHQAQSQGEYTNAQAPLHYPYGGVNTTGSAEKAQSGAEFNLGH